MWNIDERYGSIGFHEAKQCALICVDEICEAIKPIRYGLDYINKRDDWDEVKEEINCVLESRIDRSYEAWHASEKEQMFRAVDDVIGDGTLEVPVPDMSRETIYDDEPKTEKEVEAHKECAEIRKAAWKEIQQLIEMSVGVLLDERQAQAIEKDKKVQVLRSKMVYKRKYEISPTDGYRWKKIQAPPQTPQAQLFAGFVGRSTPCPAEPAKRLASFSPLP
jgi:hypothetical protein